MSLESVRNDPKSEIPELLVPDETPLIPKKKKKKKKKKKEYEMFSKNAVGLLRTTLRNNTDFTNIADNKANVLLSLNALMLTFFVPLILPNIDLVREYRLTIPLVLSLIHI